MANSLNFTHYYSKSTIAGRNVMEFSVDSTPLSHIREAVQTADLTCQNRLVHIHNMSDAGGGAQAFAQLGPYLRRVMIQLIALVQRLWANSNDVVRSHLWATDRSDVAMTSLEPGHRLVDN